MRSWRVVRGRVKMSAGPFWASESAHELPAQGAVVTYQVEQHVDVERLLDPKMGGNAAVLEQPADAQIGAHDDDRHRGDRPVGRASFEKFPPAHDGHHEIEKNETGRGG